ncbi:MAG: KpsF/GutQ family sugar-phosphate isomerase [Betaproteobacteria bacterium]|nr:KpsF/GutQ family sugar-phosphate isomerase [Betaproteobacteria bacterium]NBT05417.1 KpsF/GutQ family sugar-phosphate isomerase [Betaproteobacteria bacterium]NDE53244.1 KpsF/GutQ family sugar-phosphate isomerase [Actinomycetota bacterium]
MIPVNLPAALPHEQVARYGKDVLGTEAEAISAASHRLGEHFAHACGLMLRCRGRVVVVGVGKSGHVGRKIAATLASTGTPSFFVHAAEAGHGDLGMFTADDVVLALSNSGETEEVCHVAPLVKRFGAALIAMTGNEQSTLAKAADVHLDASISREACPHNLAPTASTAVQMALGDALAMTLVHLRGFTPEDFARTHPKGALGRRLYVKVEDIMQPSASMPVVSPQATLPEVIASMAEGRAGAVLVAEGDMEALKLKGIFTDSDLRRLINTRKGTLSGLDALHAKDVMKANPFSIDAALLASEALRIMEEKRVSRLPCLRAGFVVGLLSLHDLLLHKIL